MKIPRRGRRQLRARGMRGAGAESPPDGRPRLRELARYLGIFESYTALEGERRFASDATREALIAAMGYDAGSEVAAERSLRDLLDRERENLLEPARVAFEGAAEAARVSMPLPCGSGASVPWWLEVRLESGELLRAEGRASTRARQRTLSLALPETLPPGYHRLRIGIRAAGEWREAQQLRIVAPRRCATADELLAGRRAFGLWTNLYALRSQRNWGVGDLGDLRRLVDFAGARGAAFVGVNPLHSLWNRGEHVSPYGPVSRLFRNPLYVELEAIPEFAASTTALERPAGEIARLREARVLDYERVMALKRPVLDSLYRAFRHGHLDRATPRGRAYARFLEEQGEALDDFATFLALAEHLAGRLGDRSRDWRCWPTGYRDPRSDAVRSFRAERAELVDFHRWVQFELDRQLGQVREAARSARLPIGIYSDLAIGSDAGGSDTWAFRGSFASDASVGAPPDDFSASGQDWSFPPLDPRGLRSDRFGYWIRLLRAAFAHAGALRIDHVMGLSRLYWIPRGGPASAGAYVRYPERELMGILALESRRQGALVIGEDLGTLPAALATRLARRGILSSRVLYFERDGNRFRASHRYSPRALVTANTHDLVPLAGFFAKSDLRARRRAGQIESDADLERESRRREADCRALVRRLRAEGVLKSHLPTEAELSAAVTAFLCRTPAPLVGLSLDDLAGESVPVNLPGVAPDAAANWTRRMGVSLEELGDHPIADAALAAVPDERRSRG